MYKFFLKRLLDLLVSLLLIVLLVPIFIFVSLLILSDMGRPVLFAQIRSGKNKNAFKIFKFRTMKLRSHRFPVPINMEDDSNQITRFGFVLRNTSIDELPGFVNVLLGQMSVVGPRPLLPEYLPLYTLHQARRHEVKPGITGWAQVNGRNGISWDQKFELDVWYVDNRSFFLDLKIVIKTVGKVLKCDGVSASDEVTMPRFKGKNK